MGLSGKSPDINKAIFDSRLRVCLQFLKEHPNEGYVIHYDLESGFPEIRTREWQDYYLELWECCKPKLMNPFDGKVIIVGTSGKI